MKKKAAKKYDMFTSPWLRVKKPKKNFLDTLISYKSWRNMNKPAQSRTIILNLSDIKEMREPPPGRLKLPMATWFEVLYNGKSYTFMVADQMKNNSEFLLSFANSIINKALDKEN